MEDGRGGSRRERQPHNQLRLFVFVPSIPISISISISNAHPIFKLKMPLCRHFP
jgi:hypothetical protein